MRLTLKVLGIFVGMAVCGFLLPHMTDGNALAGEDCGIECAGGGGSCDDLPLPPMTFLACCGGHCSGYQGDDPVFECWGRCSINDKLCDCNQIGCHSLPICP
ncbi:MAG: hypothetical protein OEV49_03580 [candidate division Zixibacteria bacterium]|nr:hypothetical protein [candidate division Zixibacteria bacterium]MDH3937832.1 hypothetical protein [candidate division Zixibacteria bacterium]MDH4035261.1 hypothetical protein [candidate division Zixibacteria bacterium]